MVAVIAVEIGLVVVVVAEVVVVAVVVAVEVDVVVVVAVDQEEGTVFSKGHLSMPSQECNLGTNLLMTIL